MKTWQQIICKGIQLIAVIGTICLVLNACGSSSTSAPTLHEATNEKETYQESNVDSIFVESSDMSKEVKEDIQVEVKEDIQVEAQEERDHIYDGNIGPLVYTGTVKDGFTVYQYNIADGTKKEVFSFNNTKGYRTTADFSINAIPCYQLKEIFSNDMTKLAVSWMDGSDGGNKVGWIDNEGNLTNITDLIHPITSDFSSVVPLDSSPIFTPDGNFMFSDHNSEKYVFVDPETYEILSEEEIMHASSFNYPVWDVLILPNGDKVELVTISADYATINYGEYKYSVCKIKNGPPKGLFGYDFTDTGAVVGIGRTGSFGSEYSIGKYGIGVTEPNNNNKFSVDSAYPIFEQLTPATDYQLEQCVYNNSRIAFTGTRGQNRVLFWINDGNGEQAVNQITEIPRDENLLFWR